MEDFFSPPTGAIDPPAPPVTRRKPTPARKIPPVQKPCAQPIAGIFPGGRGAHLPAMKNTAFGQMLRTLELKRAFN
ncbi:hypothetical protein H0P39_23360 [Escherichia coli]|uniref:hypothetical protein n=1 Tax=Escherichia coli TaxID=562 RepID=UPI0015D78BDF|nr:hypothetical protein [Escherichia coli]